MPVDPPVYKSVICWAMIRTGVLMSCDCCTLITACQGRLEFLPPVDRHHQPRAACVASMAPITSPSESTVLGSRLKRSRAPAPPRLVYSWKDRTPRTPADSLRSIRVCRCHGPESAVLNEHHIGIVDAVNEINRRVPHPAEGGSHILAVGDEVLAQRQHRRPNGLVIPLVRRDRRASSRTRRIEEIERPRPPASLRRRRTRNAGRVGFAGLAKLERRPLGLPSPTINGRLLSAYECR